MRMSLDKLWTDKCDSLVDKFLYEIWAVGRRSESEEIGGSVISVSTKTKTKSYVTTRLKNHKFFQVTKGSMWFT